LTNRKYILTIFLLTIIFFCCKTGKHAEKNTPVSIGELPVDTVVTVTYITSKDRNTYKEDYLRDNAKYLAERDGYDAENRHVEHIRYSPGGAIEEHIVYVFRNGRIEEEYRLENQSEVVLYKTFWIYDREGRLSSKIGFTFRKNIKVSNGFSREYEERKSWGQKATETFMYNDRGWLREQKASRENGAVVSEVYTYDSLGRVIVQDTWTNGQNTPRIRTEYFRDSVKTNSTFFSIGENSGTLGTQKYDSRSNLVDEQAIDKETGNLFYRRLYTYDGENRVLKMEYITNTGHSLFTKYGYETHKTPVTRTLIVDDK